MTLRFFIFSKVLPLWLILFLVIILFLTGCTAYDVVKHQTFTMQVPQWEQQNIQRSLLTGPSGFYTSDDICSINLTFHTASYLAVAQPLFERLRSADPASIIDYTLLEFLVSLTYRLPDGQRGEAKILDCPSDYTYLVAYQCPASLFPSRQEEIDYVLGSMACQ